MMIPVRAVVGAMLLGSLFVKISEVEAGELQASRFDEKTIKEWNSDREVNLLYDNLLVKARTIERDDQRERIWTWMKIEHVFYGPADLKDKLFLVKSPKAEPEGSGPFSVYPAPELNDLGIWRLKFWGNYLHSYPTGANLFSVATPAFKRDTQAFKTALAFADVVERVAASADREKQLAQLKELALSPTPEIARWAVAVLSNQRPAEIGDFLTGLIANPKSSVAAEIAADNALLKRNLKNWQHTDRRIKMLKNWVKRNSTDPEAEEIARKFSVMVQHLSLAGVEQTTMLELLSDGALNEKIALNIRCRFAAIHGSFAAKDKDDEAFAALAKLVTKSADDAVKLRAARTLAVKFTLNSPKRRRIVRDLMESDKSGAGGEWLRAYRDWDAFD